MKYVVLCNDGTWCKWPTLETAMEYAKGYATSAVDLKCYVGNITHEVTTSVTLRVLDVTTNASISGTVERTPKVSLGKLD